MRKEEGGWEDIVIKMRAGFKEVGMREMKELRENKKERGGEWKK